MKRLHVILAASLSAATILAGMYAVAATAAATIAAGFSTTEATSREDNVAFTATLTEAAAEHRAGRARCKVLVGAQREACNVAVTDRDRHAFSVRTPWKPPTR